MTKIFIYALLILGPIKGACQDYEIPEMKDYHMRSFYWNDTLIDTQKSYWDNGELQVEYTKLEDGKRLKREYSYEGRLKLEAEVLQYFTIDTIRTMDIDSGEISEDIKEGYTDLPDGKYQEYHNSSYSKDDIVKTTGQYDRGTMVGLWSTKKGPLSYTVTATFNSEGNLEGEYSEYYANYRDPLKELKYVGNYGRYRTKRFLKDYELNKYVYKDLVISRRVGEWKFYDRDGRILETIVYKSNEKTEYNTE